MYLVTGVAGFIGSDVALRLLARGEEVVGVDSVDDYYDISLKEARLDRLRPYSGFTFFRGDVADEKFIHEIASKYPGVRKVIHLAAQAGVRYSLENPYVYTKSNVHGQLCMLELARGLSRCEHFVYASSSSVYGDSRSLPLKTEERADYPVSVYAATKRAGELLASCYTHTYQLPATGLRFFTVYGPWGRPDMAAFIFTRSIIEGKPIRLFNSGQMTRDFTYIDDIVTGVIKVTDTGPKPPTAGQFIYNIGNHRPEKILDFIGVLERAIGKKAIIETEPMQLGDVKDTYADVEPIRRDYGFAPSTSIEAGLPKFVQWYRDFYNA